MGFPSRFRDLVVGFAAALLVCAATADSAYAQITDEEAACRARISSSLGKYARALNKAFNGCHKRRDKGDLPSSTDCNDSTVADVNTKSKAARTLSKESPRILEDCSSVPSVLTEFPSCPAPFEALDDGGAAGIDNVTELLSCQIAHIRNQLEMAYALAMDSPVDLVGDQIKCHAAIGKALGKIVDATVKGRRKCQTALDDVGGPLSFQCATADPSLRIQDAIEEGALAIGGACDDPGSAEAVGSCAADAAGLASCVTASASTTGGGTAALLWELPGICPGAASIEVRPDLDDSDHDYGWTGSSSDSDPASGFVTARLTATSCDPDCSNCTATGAAAAGSCRCSGDSSVLCAINADCAGFGGTCECFANPPLHFSIGGTPICITNRIEGAISGSFNSVTEDASLSMLLRQFIHIGISQVQPCPACLSGTCDGGPRDGLACTVDGSDPTFGAVSFDCPPDPLVNLTGLSGISIPMNLASGSSPPLPFNIPCDAPLGFLDCSCGTCSGNHSIACNSDDECDLAAAGLCVSDGHGGASRRPNTCSDLTCSPDPNLAADEGTCLAGPLDRWCDGFLRADGGGVIFCSDDADCDAYFGICPGHEMEGCGQCSISKNRDCFLDPIAATGTAGEVLVTTGCLAASSNGAVNSAIGLPGPFRVRQSVSMSTLCSDGVTPYEGPGGSNCLP